MRFQHHQLKDIKSWIIGNPSDPLWDIDVLPLTYTDSRWSAFVLDVDAESRQRLCPNPPLTVWDGDDAELVEYWYVQHNNTMLGPYLEFGVTISQLTLMLKVMHGKQVISIHVFNIRFCC